MRAADIVFVDTGAWIALALTRDPLHPQARATWDTLLEGGARLRTSVPVVIETFTFLERNAARDAALAWRESLAKIPHYRLLECTCKDLESSWEWFLRADLHRLSAVDATSFTIMKRAKIRAAFAFDHHFAMAGFRLVG
jgi:predicted nucleic acid-binding protein